VVEKRCWSKRLRPGVPWGAISRATASGKGRGRDLGSEGPNSGNLDRVQGSKSGKHGQQHEKVFDGRLVRVAQDRSRDRQLPAVGNTVNLESGAYDDDIGATEIAHGVAGPAVSIRANQRFTIYECSRFQHLRWSTLLAVRNHLPLPRVCSHGTATRLVIPIWYTTPSQTAGPQAQGYGR